MGGTRSGNRIALVLENVEPFGRGLRGRSNVFITKDRPGHLRAHGKATKTPGKTFVGTLVIDDTGTPDFIEFYAPKDDEDAPESVTSAGLADIVRAPARRPDPAQQTVPQVSGYDGICHTRS